MRMKRERLFHAVWSGNAKKVRRLLRVPGRFRPMHYVRALRYAAEQGHAECVDLLKAHVTLEAWVEGRQTLANVQRRDGKVHEAAVTEVVTLAHRSETSE